MLQDIYVILINLFLLFILLAQLSRINDQCDFFLILGCVLHL